MIVNRRPVSRATAALASLLALSVGPARAQTTPVPVQMAHDALTLFAEGCIETLADPRRVPAKMTQFKATKLDDAEAAKLTASKPGGQAWRVDSPAGAQLVLTLVPPIACNVMVRRADATTLQDGATGTLDAIAKGTAIRYQLEHHSERKAPGGTEETTEFLLQLHGDRDASVSVTTNPGTEEDLQGLLSFVLLGLK
jgi:hypothetical protein